ncbi:MBL fold metallo-hydrolase [Candidatus Nanopelagicales bacterium]|nr:MBL fold metallo-hydrolase [Candidatus Nanopelagicales bacterium]
MPGTITPRELYNGISEGTIPFILDVRNQDEFAAWQVEGTKPVDTKNVPIWVAVEDVESLAKDVPQDSVVICAHGNGSAMLLDMLSEAGVETRNLEGGTAAWAELLVPMPLQCLPEGVVGWQILRPSKACLSYMIGVPGKDAIVVDPARYPDPYIELAASEGMTITHVIDTHVHADHISGGHELAEKVGAEYHLPLEDAGGSIPWPNTPLEDGTEIDLGGHTVATFAIKMPGHTPGTTCVHIPGHLLLTGDTVFVRGVGRPDLTGKADELARELYFTVNEKLRPLDSNTTVLPAHWSTVDEMGDDGMVKTTLGQVFESTLLNEEDLVKFVEEIVGTLPSAPDFYDTIREVNSGKQVSADEIETLEIGKNQCAASNTI